MPVNMAVETGGLVSRCLIGTNAVPSRDPQAYEYCTVGTHVVGSPIVTVADSTLYNNEIYIYRP
jgi:hypothetical protein